MTDLNEQLERDAPPAPEWFQAEPPATAATATELAEFIDQPDPEDVAEFVDDDWSGRIPPCPHLLWHPIGAGVWLVRAVFGIVTLLFLLAVLAAIPVLNFLALGYLLEVEGRVARSGRIRDAFVLLSVAPRIGTIYLGVWLWIIPLRLLAGYAADARLIDPGGTAAAVSWRLTLVLAVLIACHLCLAIARGGSFWCFFRPIKNVRDFIARLRAGTFWREANDRVGEFVSRMRPGHLFSLGLRGFLTATVWLALPTLLFAAAQKTEGLPILVTLFGGVCLVLVFAWVPFLQAHFAAENRFSAVRELGRVRELFRRAPLSWLAAVIVVFVLALPLYLLKVRLLPQDAMWFITLVFVVSIFPARVVTGWAYHRAVVKERQAWFGLRWLSRGVMAVLLALYVFVLYFTQYIGEHGKWVLFEHHAFLLPSPFSIFAQ